MTKSVFKWITCLSLFWCSCEKKSTAPLAPAKPDCEANSYGTITVSNSSTNPYELYIDDVFQMEIPGKTITEKIRISEGNNRELYVIQVSGYLLYPTERTKSLNVISCSDYSWQIP